MYRPLILTIASLGLATAPLAAAQAAGTVEQRRVGVSYSDLDLTTEAGRAELNRRIDQAAKAACGMEEDALGTRLPTRDQRTCYTDARSQLDQRFAQVLARSQSRG